MLLYLQNADVPSGIAFNQALKENFFSIIVCVQNQVPLIINGRLNQNSVVLTYVGFGCICTEAVLWTVLYLP